MTLHTEKILSAKIKDNTEQTLKRITDDLLQGVIKLFDSILSDNFICSWDHLNVRCHDEGLLDKQLIKDTMDTLLLDYGVQVSAIHIEKGNGSGARFGIHGSENTYTIMVAPIGE